MAPANWDGRKGFAQENDAQDGGDERVQCCKQAGFFGAGILLGDGLEGEAKDGTDEDQGQDGTPRRRIGRNGRAFK